MGVIRTLGIELQRSLGAWGEPLGRLSIQDCLVTGDKCDVLTVINLSPKTFLSFDLSEPINCNNCMGEGGSVSSDQCPPVIIAESSPLYS